VSAAPLSFAHSWRAEILTAPPLIAPARQFTYPRAIAGEEDALARGALQLLVHPAKNSEADVRVAHSSRDLSRAISAENTAPFLATCALGFTDPSMPTGLYSCPNPQELCAVAGGYAYIIDSTAPQRSTHVPLRPVTEVVVIPEPALLLFAGFHSIVAWGAEGLAWQTARLSWEGLRLTGVSTGPDVAPVLYGLGWNLHTDKEVEFAVDLRTGTHTGGGF
jgi:hypothetical protein